MARDRAAATFRVVTYNIHKGIGGVDRKYRPERIVDVLRACRADVLLLQEVDEGVPRSRGHRQVDWLGDALALEHRAYAPNVRLKEGHYGNAVLSRFPLDHVENIDVTVPPKKRRGALHVRFTVESKGKRRRVWLYNVHLGLAEYERRRQVRKLLTWHDAHRLREHTTTVIGGDMNDVWRRIGPLLLEPGGFVGIPNRPATFPAVRPVRALDAVFVKNPSRIVRYSTPIVPPARSASDHLPLVVTLGLL